MSIPIPDGHTAFVMPIDGEVLIDGQRFNLIEPKLPVSLPQSEDRIVTLLANKRQGCAVFWPPLHQPVYWQGPLALASPKRWPRPLRATSVVRSESYNLVE